MVDIAISCSPTPTPTPTAAPASSGGAAAGTGNAAGAAGSCAPSGADDAARDEAGGAHRFAELLATLAAPTSSPDAGASADAAASPTSEASDQPSDALYAMVGMAMAAMPVTPLIAAETPAAPIGDAMASTISPATINEPGMAGAALSTTGDSGGATTFVDASLAGADMTGVRSPTPTGPVAQDAATQQAASTDVTTTPAAPAAPVAASDASSQPAMVDDAKVPTKGRARAVSSDKASTDATKIDATGETGPLAGATAPGGIAAPVLGDGGTGDHGARTGHEQPQAQPQISTTATTASMTGTPTNGVASSSSVSGSMATAGAQQAQPWEQVLAVLRPTRRFTDGSHRLSIQMTPDDLGTVTIELSMHRGQLSMHMLTETQGAADALRSSLHELRADLEGSGQRTGSFEVAQQWAQHRQNQSEFAKAARLSGIDTGAPIGAVATVSAAIDLTTPVANVVGDGRLDLRI